MPKAAHQIDNMSEYAVFMKKYPDDILCIRWTLYGPQNRITFVNGSEQQHIVMS